jgi:NTE family protein
MFLALELVGVGATNPAAQRAPAEGAPRPRIGVAFGGGSARGFAHVGVIRWFEEHHIPIDLVGGTSMGGLVGGAFSTGMSSHELEAMLVESDWNKMFGASSYRFKNIRRKEDARAYPSRLEFGLRHGLGLPSSLNNGQQVDLLLARITAAYAGLASFDDLPTPFRCVAVDLKTAAVVVRDRGSLAQALRATMSLPGVFPPVEVDGRVLVDGGAMDNVPADVVRSMGADLVIAVNVGSMSEERSVSQGLFGLMGNTVDAMMLASTRRGMAAADIVINPALDKFGSLDWRKGHALIEAGYAGAAAMQDRLLPLALDDAAWEAYLRARQARRRTGYPQPVALIVTGALPADEARIRALLEPRLSQPLDVQVLQTDLEALSGLDRYETLNWDIVPDPRRPEALALLIRAREKLYAPPFLMLSTNIQNTTSDDFSFQLAARYLTYDKAGARSELRLDAGLGSTPSLGAALYRPIGKSPLFVTISGVAFKRRFNFVDNDALVAQYDETRALAQLDGGIQIGRDVEVRTGLRVGFLDADLRVGNPGLPSASGREVAWQTRAIYDGQDSVVVPSSGLRAVGAIRHVFDAPGTAASLPSGRTNDDLTQAQLDASRFWSLHTTRDRVFLAGGLGTSFGDHPLPTDQFSLGLPLRLGAFDLGERRGDHYGSVTGGYLRGIGRLPDFLGGSIFGGAWLENGSAFDRLADADWATQVGFGIIADTVLGPVLAGATVGFDGRRRYYIGVGRVFP